MKSHPTPHTQRGAVLISALLILIVMTIVGVAALSTTSLGERMTANMQERLLAFFSAESPVAALIENVRTIAMNAVPPNPAFAAVTNGTQTYPDGTLIQIPGMTNTTTLTPLAVVNNPTSLGISGYSSQYEVQVLNINSTSIRTGSRAPATSALQLGLVSPIK